MDGQIDREIKILRDRQINEQRQRDREIQTDRQNLNKQQKHSRIILRRQIDKQVT